MTKNVIGFLAAISILYSCHTSAQSDKRKDVIGDFISAVKINDTNSLYLIVDTSEYFDVQSKEHFLYQLEFLKKRFTECGSIITDSTIKISRRDIPFTDYTYSFCSGAKDKEFEIKFTFADFANKNRINFIEIKNNYRNTTPTTPPSSQ